MEASGSITSLAPERVPTPAIVAAAILEASVHTIAATFDMDLVRSRMRGIVPEELKLHFNVCGTKKLAEKELGPKESFWWKKFPLPTSKFYLN